MVVEMSESDKNTINAMLKGRNNVIRAIVEAGVSPNDAGKYIISLLVDSFQLDEKGFNKWVKNIRMFARMLTERGYILDDNKED